MALRLTCSGNRNSPAACAQASAKPRRAWRAQKQRPHPLCARRAGWRGQLGSPVWGAAASHGGAGPWHGAHALIVLCATPVRALSGAAAASAATASAAFAAARARDHSSTQNAPFRQAQEERSLARGWASSECSAVDSGLSHAAHLRFFWIRWQLRDCRWAVHPQPCLRDEAQARAPSQSIVPEAPGSTARRHMRMLALLQGQEGARGGPRASPATYCRANFLAALSSARLAVSGACACVVAQETI
ncbi:hypothetical protein LPJ57_008189 [Coemansia sp. RSA 486]|nr:hypothetical protein LPJ57_008189 [Coemansia sp. RSA 486]